MKAIEEILLSSKIDKFISRRKHEVSEIIPMGKWAHYEYIPAKYVPPYQRKKLKK